MNQGQSLKLVEQQQNKAWDSNEKKHSKHNQRGARVHSVEGKVPSSCWRLTPQTAAIQENLRADSTLLRETGNTASWQNS